MESSVHVIFDTDRTQNKPQGHDECPQIDCMQTVLSLYLFLPREGPSLSHPLHARIWDAHCVSADLAFRKVQCRELSGVWHRYP